MKKENPLLMLPTFGQSIWLDFISRGSLVSGELERLIKEDGLRGVTSNPSIFEKAIDGSEDYDETIFKLARAGRSDEEIYEALAVEDVQRAADLFRPVHKRAKGKDGFVSLEVSPRLAYDTEATIAEAHRLWGAVNRPNVLIKVPATREGIPAIRRLLTDGININVTLLFGLPRYQEVAEAFLAAMEARVAEGKAIDRLASVASFFLSRIDAKVDPLLEKTASFGGPKAAIAQSLRGQVAIACAKNAYEIYRHIFSAERFQRLADKGVTPQRVLWASTSTKNPEYSDVMYVDALIGPDTVNTVPLETLNAYRDHGEPAPRLEEDMKKARDVLNRLPELGIDLAKVTQALEEEGVQKFVAPYESLLASLDGKCAEALGEAALHHMHGR